MTTLAAAATPIVFATAGTPGSDAASGSWVGGLVFTGPFEPLVLWTLPGSGGRVGTCIDANAHGPLSGPYTKRSSINDPVYAELNHLYARADASDVHLAELSALVSHKYDHVDRDLQWGYVLNHRGGMSTTDANSMLARAKTLAGPYTVAVTWPAGDTATNTAYSATVTVTSSSGNPVPGAVVSLTGTNVTLTASSATTNSAGHAIVGFRIPDGTSSTFTISASVQSWTSVDVYASAGEQQMMVPGPPSTQKGQNTGPVVRQRAVYLVKVAADDPTHTPLPGYTYEISDAAGHVVLPSVTTGAAATDASLGQLVVGATYHAREVSVPPGAKLYIPVEATTTFVVPPGTSTWTLVAADPRMPTPSISTQVSSAAAVVGELLVDDVLVSGDDGEDGTISATLYGPVPPPPSRTCSDLTLGEFTAAPVHHLEHKIDGARSGGNGTHRLVGPPASAAGCWGWGQTLTLTPSGATASSPPTAATESTLVTVPQVATTVSAQIAAIGAQLTDSVVVTGLNGQQAQLKAVLYGPLPGDARSGCSQYTATAWQVAITHAGATLTADTADVDVVGDGAYVTTPVRLTRPGCYTYRETLTPASTPETPVVTPLGVGQESTIVVTPDVHTVASSNQGDAGSLVRDHVLVSGTFGTSGTVSAELLGPVHDVHGSCAGLDWTNAPLAAALPPITTSGDGNYETAPTRLSRTGCYTFVESLLLGSVTTPFMHTPPGVPAETVLIRPPAPAAPHAGPPLARTGVPTLALVGGGVATVAGGGLVLLLGRRRER